MNPDGSKSRVVDEEAAAVVRRIFNMTSVDFALCAKLAAAPRPPFLAVRLDGMGTHQIAKRLNVYESVDVHYAA